MFKAYKIAVDKQLKEMSKGELFTVNIDKDELWNLYLDSFPKGTNEIFRERREYDCSCCRNFIKNIGNVVSVIEGKLVSIWDTNTGIDKYDVVSSILSEKIKSCEISGIYRSNFKEIGTDYNMEDINNEPKKWNHFFHVLDDKFVLRNKRSIGDFNGEAIANRDVLKRSLTEINLESCEVVLELISQNSIYRGNEHKNTVTGLKNLLKEHNDIDNKELYYWTKSSELNARGRYKNTVIGTLLSDISEGVELEDAVKMFESKVAPSNYKRSSALVTKSMIDQAEKKVIELGISDSLPRRYAVAEDITVNNVIFADRSVKSSMGGSVFDELKEETPDKTPNLDRVQEVTIDKFISDVVPTANNIELMIENSHADNLMSLIAPVNTEAPNILKWGNNFSWTYNGDLTDSMKSNVKKAGGRVDGVLRFSIQWNDKNDNKNDLDAHCIEPDLFRICYEYKRSRLTGGELDVDIVHPNGVAVENIIYPNKDKMIPGEYEFLVHNFSDRGGKGFTVEIEFDGKIYSFSHQKKVREGEYVKIATVTLSESGEFSIKEHLDSNLSSKKVWGVNTCKWNKVNMIMNSPNHWNGEETGNKHYFFILDKCKNEEKTRGLYNEFLSVELTPHRKVFEMLGSKMKTEESDNQLSGVGFSSTVSNTVLCKVTGKTNRVIKIKF